MSPMTEAAEEGGFGATVAALAVGQVLSWAAMFYAFSSFVLPMQREFGWDKPTLMGAFTTGLALHGAATYAVGAAIDHGRGRLVLTGGALAAGLGLLAWSQVTQPWMLYACWALMGASMAALLYEPAFMVVTKRYPERFRQAITRITLVGGFASTLCYPAVAALIGGLGWRGALVVMGGVMIAFVAPLHAWALRGPAHGSTSRHHDAADDATLHQALRTPAFWLLTLTFTGYAFVSTAFWAHVMPAFAEKGFSEAAATAVLVWFGPAQVAGRFVHAVAGGGLRLRLLGLVVLAAVPLSLLWFALAHSLPVLVGFAIVFGVANGLVTIVRGGLVPEYFGRTHIGRISGLMAAVALLARALAPWSLALLLLLVQGYRQAIFVLAALGFASALAFWLARKPA